MSQDKKMIGLVEQKWLSYKKNVLPPNACDVQITETRRGFFAGAVSLFSIMNHIGGDHVTEEEACILLDSIQEELQSFADNVGTEAEKKVGGSYGFKSQSGLD